MPPPFFILSFFYICLCVHLLTVFETNGAKENLVQGSARNLMRTLEGPVTYLKLPRVFHHLLRHWEVEWCCIPVDIRPFLVRWTNKTLLHCVPDSQSGIFINGFQHFVPNSGCGYCTFYLMCLPFVRFFLIWARVLLYSRCGTWKACFMPAAFNVTMLSNH